MLAFQRWKLWQYFIWTSTRRKWWTRLYMRSFNGAYYVSWRQYHNCPLLRRWWCHDVSTNATFSPEKKRWRKENWFKYLVWKDYNLNSISQIVYSLLLATILFWRHFLRDSRVKIVHIMICCFTHRIVQKKYLKPCFCGVIVYWHIYDALIWLYKIKDHSSGVKHTIGGIPSIYIVYHSYDITIVKYNEMLENNTGIGQFLFICGHVLHVRLF